MRHAIDHGHRSAETIRRANMPTLRARRLSRAEMRIDAMPE